MPHSASVVGAPGYGCLGRRHQLKELALGGVCACYGCCSWIGADDHGALAVAE